MKITRLELENWMGIPRLALEFGAGINLLYGRNEIGKSSIIESIRQALLGDANSSKPEYKMLKPWGVEAKARVKLSFTSGGDTLYRICKAFPGGGAELYQGDILLSDETKKTQEKLYKILDISEKTTNLFRLLFIDQGDTLNIFDKKGKENPLDENTKSYIKEIIKETAFKEIQEMQNVVEAEIDRYLTDTRRAPKKGTDYFQRLKREEELSAELEKLLQQEQEIKDKLETIEKAGKEIAVLTGEIENKEKYLEALKKKKTRLEELKQKETGFELVQKDYDEYIKITGELEELRRRQPVLAVTRQQRIDELKKELLQLETQKAQSRERLEQLKQKKQVWEKLESLKGEFRELKQDYDKVSNLEKQRSETQAEMPTLLVLHRDRLQEELQSVTDKIRGRSQLETEKAGLETRLKEMPVIAPLEIDTLRKLEKENEKFRARIDSAKEKLKLSLRMTPLAGKEIPFRYARDGEEPVQGKTVEPLEVGDFHRLDLTYPEHLEIQVKGKLSETDIDAVQETLNRNSHQIQEKLAVFGVGDIEALEQKHIQRKEAETRLKSLQEQLQTMGEAAALVEQEKAVRDQLAKLDRDEQTYLKATPEVQPEPRTAGEVKEIKARGTAAEVRERLTVAKTRIDGYRQEIERVLTARQCTFAQLEALYNRQETELRRQENEYEDMEPKAVVIVDQARLESEIAQATEIEKKMTTRQEELKLLETMENVETMETMGVPPVGEGQGIKALTGLSTQQIRDDIIQSWNRSRDLEQDKKNLLKETDDQEFRMNYFRRKDEIDAIRKALAAIPPENLNDLEKIDAEIENTGKEIKSAVHEKGEIEKQRERLKGETADYARVMEEKTGKEGEYRQVLEEIRSGIVELSSLRLLIQLIEEERNRAQQEVFRPLQERVHRSFTALVGERYRVGIDNDLNLEISGRTVSGEFQAVVGEALSFGTREQLSFLFRLAIAAQLSRREPAVMVLDDSFVNTDLHRLPVLMDMLIKREEEMQFLVFTCRPGDYLSYLTRTGDKEDKYVRGIDLEKVMT